MNNEIKKEVVHRDMLVIDDQSSMCNVT